MDPESDEEKSFCESQSGQFCFQPMLHQNDASIDPGKCQTKVNYQKILILTSLIIYPSLQRKTNLWKWEIFSKLCYRIDFTLTLRQKLRSRQIKGACGQKTGRAILFPQRRERRTRQESEHDQLHFFLIVIFVSTRSYAALRAADLDWIVGPGYSLGLVHSGEKP